MQSGRRGQIKHVYVRRRASTRVDVRRRASTEVDARDARRATDVDGRRRARCEWALTRAAAFMTRCSLSVQVFGAFANSATLVYMIAVIKQHS